MNDAGALSLPRSVDDVPGVPKKWFGSGEEKAFAARLGAASGRTLLLDYDGTLAPFHADKMQALPYAGVPETLERLHQRADTRIVLVSGRRAADLLRLLEVAKDLEIWGSHGREHIDRHGEYTFYQPSREQESTLFKLAEEIEARLRGRMLRLCMEDVLSPSHQEGAKIEVPEPLEKKPASLAVHWRGLDAASQELLRNEADEVYFLWGNSSIERLPFASGVEFRAAGYTKAFAVSRVLEQSGEDSVVAYLGDDLTDEDAFGALQDRGESFLVQPAVRSSLAKYWLAPPEDLLRFLRSWLQV